MPATCAAPMEDPENTASLPSILELKGETFHQPTTGTSDVPGRLDEGTRSKDLNRITVVGVCEHFVFHGATSDSDGLFDTGRGDRPGIGGFIASYKEFIHRQVWEVVGNDVPEVTTVTPD